MLNEVPASYRQRDAGIAKQAAGMDDEIDTEHRNLVEKLFTVMQSSPALIPNTSRMLWISHILERYGDHATDIAEQIVLMLNAEVIELDCLDSCINSVL